jgi:23S rRNA maturation-related 3'-5' exoribonuclease YhaM
MTISELFEQPGSFEGLLVRVVGFEEKTTRAGKPYLHVTVQDSSKTTSFPIWVGFSKLVELWKQTPYCRMDGMVTFYAELPQLSPTKYYVPTEEEIASLSSLSEYDISGAWDFLLDTISKLSPDWKAVSYLALGFNKTGDFVLDPSWMEDFKNAPAAKTHHSNKKGGLVIHTAGVVRNCIAMFELYHGDGSFVDVSEAVDIDRLLFCALIHDFGKVDDYVIDGTVKWNPERKISHLQDVPAIVERICSGAETQGCAEVPFKQREVCKYNILAHHGFWSDLKPNTLEAWILHWADMLDGVAHETAEGRVIVERFKN